MSKTKFILKQTVYGAAKPLEKGSVIELTKEESTSDFWKGMISPMPKGLAQGEGADDDTLAQRDGILAAAQAQADQIIADAQAQADVIRKEAEQAAAKGKLDPATPAAASKRQG